MATKHSRIKSIRQWVFDYYVYLLLGFGWIVCLFVETHITRLFNKVTVYLSDCSETYFAIATILIVIFAIAVIMWKISVNKRYIAHSTMALITFGMGVYLYYRFYNSSFVFWGWDPYFTWSDLFLLPYLLLWVEKIVYKQKKSDSKSDYFILADEPINNIAEDQFGYVQLVRSLLDSFNSLNLTKHSYSVGITGVWGSGKSSFLNILAKLVENDDIVVRFNPRSARFVGKIQEEFFSALSSKLREHHTGVKTYIAQYADAIGAVDEGWMGKIASMIVSMSVEEGKDRINKAIKEIGRRLFIIVEDLDRLTGEEIIEVLKLIDGNGDFCYTIFLTAYDKGYANSVIRQYLNADALQDYTDKYFSYELPLPVQNKNTLSSYFCKYIENNVTLVESDLLTQKQMVDIWNENSKYIVAQLKTMRHIKRFINLFMTRYPKVKNDVTLHDYLYVTLLRYTDINTYSAISEGRILSRGTVFGRNKKLLYLNKNYKDILKNIDAKESTEHILTALFPDVETTWENGYNSVRWADTADRYFFDYKIKVISYEEGRALFNLKEDKDAFEKIDNYIGLGYKVSMEDFFKSRTPLQIGSTDGLSRLLKLMIYLDHKERSNDIEFEVMRLLTTYGYEDYSKAKVFSDENIYKNIISNAMTYMLDYAPVEVGYVCINLINELLDKPSSEYRTILSMKEMISLAEWALNYYGQRWDNTDFLIDVYLNLGAIRVKSQHDVDSYSEVARREIISMMTQHPKDFMKKVILVHEFEHNGKMISISFRDSFKLSQLFPLDNMSFNEWADQNLEDDHIKYLSKAIANETDKFIRTPKTEDFTRGDFATLYNIVKPARDKQIDDRMKTYLEGRVSSAMFSIRRAIEVDEEDQKGSIKRLVDNDVLNPWFLTMPEFCTEYREGDYVRILSRDYGKYAKDLYYKDNVFEIEKIEGKQVLCDDNAVTIKLKDIEGKIPIGSIEAIPLDGKHDQNIYYDPIIAASTGLPGEPIPVYNRDYTYFMEQFKNSFYKGKSYHELITEKECRFVHDVQHYLMDEFGDDELKIHHIS